MLIIYQLKIYKYFYHNVVNVFQFSTVSTCTVFTCCSFTDKAVSVHPQTNQGNRDRGKKFSEVGLGATNPLKAVFGLHGCQGRGALATEWPRAHTRQSRCACGCFLGPARPAFSFVRVPFVLF